VAAVALAAAHERGTNAWLAFERVNLRFEDNDRPQVCVCMEKVAVSRTFNAAAPRRALTHDSNNHNNGASGSSGGSGGGGVSGVGSRRRSQVGSIITQLAPVFIITLNQSRSALSIITLKHFSSVNYYF
jgi:hypothetical protein